jgi:hypothetical protein
MNLKDDFMWLTEMLRENLRVGVCAEKIMAVEGFWWVDFSPRQSGVVSCQVVSERDSVEVMRELLRTARVNGFLSPGHTIQIPRPPRPCTECHAVAVLLAEADSDGRCVYCHTRRSEWRERGAGIKAEVVEEYEDGDCWERPGSES